VDDIRVRIPRDVPGTVVQVEPLKVGAIHELARWAFRGSPKRSWIASHGGWQWTPRACPCWSLNYCTRWHWDWICVRATAPGPARSGRSVTRSRGPSRCRRGGHTNWISEANDDGSARAWAGGCAGGPRKHH
jgi:hypothetical protein